MMARAPKAEPIPDVTPTLVEYLVDEIDKNLDTNGIMARLNVLGDQGWRLLFLTGERESWEPRGTKDGPLVPMPPVPMIARPRRRTGPGAAFGGKVPSGWQFRALKDPRSATNRHRQVPS